MAKVRLISENQLQQNCAVNVYTDEQVQKVLVSIDQAQNKLRAILCDDLFNAIISEYENNTLTTENAALLPYLQDWLTWQSYAVYIPFSQSTSTDAGFRQFSDENSTPADSSMLRELIRNAQDQIKLYEADLLQFMNNNKADYPLWTASNCYKCSTTGTNKSGIGLSGAGNKRPFNERII